MSNQLDLYQQVILEHNRKPRNFKEISDCSHRSEGLNPLCGDHLHIYLKLDDQELIQEVSFLGTGCAISKASASMMTTALVGKKMEEAMELFTQFQKLLRGELDPEKDANILGKLKIFSGIWQYPSRVKCAALAWHAMRGALQEDSQKISTES
jgi:nitrogen fixation NifU-like protein